MAVAKQATYSGSSVTIPVGATVNLTFDTLDEGTELLSRSDPANPTFLAAGVYAVTASYYSTAPLTPGGRAVCTIACGIVALRATTIPEDGDAITLTAKAAAGDQLLVQVRNRDGASARDFALYTATVVKLT